MNYKLVASDELSELNIQVNELLAKGWELYSHPIVKHSIWEAPDESHCLIRQYCQALIINSSNHSEDNPF